MAYSFRPSDDTLTAVLRRVAASQLKRGLDELDDDGLDRAVTIHQVRKCCKKLRGLLRLVRPGLDAYKAENTAFRDLSRLLSDARDATADIETIDEMEARFGAKVKAGLFAAARETLLARRAELDDDEIAGRLDAVRLGFVKGLERVEDWCVEGEAAEVICAGTAKTYGRAVEALAVAAESGDSEDFHEWRKRVKYHWYHLRLLQHAWPGLFEGWVGEADALSDDLGDHHDLAEFRRDTLPLIAPGSEAGAQVLDGIMRSEQARLAEAGLARGRVMFAEPADRLGARLGDYWHASGMAG